MLDNKTTERPLTLNDFEKARYTYYYRDWEDDHIFPYFWVPGGWYYLTGGMAEPVQVKEGCSILVGKDNYLKRIDPHDPNNGECLMWKQEE